MNLMHLLSNVFFLMISSNRKIGHLSRHRNVSLTRRLIETQLEPKTFKTNIEILSCNFIVQELLIFYYLD